VLRTWPYPTSLIALPYGEDVGWMNSRFFGRVTMTLSDLSGVIELRMASDGVEGLSEIGD
jgi:hypothetical protein